MHSILRGEAPARHSPTISEQTNSGARPHRRPLLRYGPRYHNREIAGVGGRTHDVAANCAAIRYCVECFDRRDDPMHIRSRLSNDSPCLEGQTIGGLSSASIRPSAHCVPMIWRTWQDRVRCSIIEDDDALCLSLAADHMRSIDYRGEPCKDRIQVNSLSQSAMISTTLPGSVAIVRCEEA